VELPDLAGLLSNRHGPAEMLSLRPRFGNAGVDSFAENLVLELSKTQTTAPPLPDRSASSIQRFGERYEADAQSGEFLQRNDQINE